MRRASEVGQRGERLVRQDRELGGEPDLVLLEELAPEELQRRQAPVHVRGEDVGIQVGPPEAPVREPAPGARAHLAGHDVGPVLVGRRDEPLQRLVTEVVVGIEEEDVAARDQVERRVPRCGRATGAHLVVHHPEHVGVARRPGVRGLPGAVGRAVVDDHDLHPVEADGLRDHRVQAPVEVGPGVVGRDDDADVGRAGATRDVGVGLVRHGTSATSLLTRSSIHDGGRHCDALCRTPDSPIAEVRPPLSW